MANCIYTLYIPAHICTVHKSTLTLQKGYERTGQTTFPFTLFLLNKHVTNAYCTLVHSRTDNCSSDFRYQSSESQLGHFLDSCKACASHSHVFPSAFSPLLKHTRKDDVWCSSYCYTFPSPHLTKQNDEKYLQELSIVQKLNAFNLTTTTHSYT